MSYPGERSDAYSGASTPAGFPPDLSRAAELLRQTKPWVRFLSVLGFIWSGLMILGGCVGGLVAVAGDQPQLIIAAIIYPAMGTLQLVPAMFLWRYADRIAGFLHGGDMQEFDAALKAQKSFWKFVGIMMIVMLCIYAVIIAFVIVAAIIGAL